MGFAPQVVDEWSFWQYSALLSAWNEAHQTGPEPPSVEDYIADREMLIASGKLTVLDAHR